MEDDGGEGGEEGCGASFEGGLRCCKRGVFALVDNVVCASHLWAKRALEALVNQLHSLLGLGIPKAPGLRAGVMEKVPGAQAAVYQRVLVVSVDIARGERKQNTRRSLGDGAHWGGPCGGSKSTQGVLMPEAKVVVELGGAAGGVWLVGHGGDMAGEAVLLGSVHELLVGVEHGVDAGSHGILAPSPRDKGPASPVG